MGGYSAPMTQGYGSWGMGMGMPMPPSMPGLPVPSMGPMGMPTPSMAMGLHEPGFALTPSMGGPFGMQDVSLVPFNSGANGGFGPGSELLLSPWGNRPDRYGGYTGGFDGVVAPPKSERLGNLPYPAQEGGYTAFGGGFGRPYDGFR